jgi:glycosyltransferase involved in cell wall biosynthesis
MRCPTLNELPPAPAGRTGWPWTEESPQLPDTMPNGQPWPRISIATPSYNQADFLEETIRGVLLQGYPDIEYIITDDGSTDHSVEVIKKYAPWLTHWETGPNRGQAHAVNNGWKYATGDLLAFINSDDVHMPEAFRKIAEAWGGAPDVAMVTGGFATTDEHSNIRRLDKPRYPFPSPADLSTFDQDKILLAQPASFYVRQHLDKVGRWMREDLRYALDREIIYRLCRQGRIILIDDPVATYRLHGSSNTVAASLRMHNESLRALAACSWGGEEARIQRGRVGRWRVAKGHYLSARNSNDPREALHHLLVATMLRPAYIANKGYFVVLLNATGLLTPVLSMKQAWRKVVH